MRQSHVVWFLHAPGVQILPSMKRLFLCCICSVNGWVRFLPRASFNIPLTHSVKPRDRGLQGMSSHASDATSKGWKTVELPKERQCANQGNCVKGVDRCYFSIDPQRCFKYRTLKREVIIIQEDDTEPSAKPGSHDLSSNLVDTFYTFKVMVKFLWYEFMFLLSWFYAVITGLINCPFGGSKKMVHRL